MALILSALFMALARDVGDLGDRLFTLLGSTEY